MTVFRDSLSGPWLNEPWGSSHRRRSLWYNLSMSEKVDSGGSSLEELEQEQVLLDWQDLPSFGRAENGVQAGSTEAIKADKITEGLEKNPKQNDSTQETNDSSDVTQENVDNVEEKDIPDKTLTVSASGFFCPSFGAIC